MKIFIFSNKDEINLPTAPTSVSFTAGDFSQMIADCELADTIYVFNLRNFIQAISTYAQLQTDSNKQALAYKLMDLVSPFIKLTPTIESFGITLSDELAYPSKYYDKTFYIRSTEENNFISSLSKEDQITINTVITAYSEKSYATDDNILIELYTQGDKLYELTI